MAGKPGMHRKTLHPLRAEELRQKIQAGLILKQLEKHILAGEEMSSTQVTAAIGLLRKCVPDLTAISGVPGGPPIETNLKIELP